jgi:hypothetical protein
MGSCRFDATGHQSLDRRGSRDACRPVLVGCESRPPGPLVAVAFLSGPGQ